MKLNYTLQSIKLKSEWFDDLGRKKNVYQKITYKGLNLYFQFYKFRLHNQENEHTFISSISLLRKETGYSTEEVFELLKKMKSAKIIDINNVSRWDYLIDQDGSVKDKEILIITATDSIPTFSKNEEGFYIYVPLKLFEKYKEAGLSEKYYALYCLIAKWSNNIERKMFMKIEKIAKHLVFDKDYVNKMIYEMNRNYFMSSYRKSRKNDFGYSFEHHLLTSTIEKDVESFLTSHKENIEKLIKRIDKKKQKKQAANIEDEMDTVEEQEEPVKQVQEVKWGFGKKKQDNWGSKRSIH
ncbi:hypothetical protein [Fictibacillus phosphorivorans]|uniref:hypothetical protein n=1 Tax=Fictibacillus phosphorivorans TaxID=1221500 RepID=UPI0035E721C3